VGTDGRLEILIPMWDQPEVKASRVIHHGKASGRKIEYDFDPVSPFDAAVRFFCEHIALHQQGNQSIATGYEVDELIAYMLQSARERCALEIRWRI
jgi:hypothetical protein